MYWFVFEFRLDSLENDVPETKTFRINAMFRYETSIVVLWSNRLDEILGRDGEIETSTATGALSVGSPPQRQAAHSQRVVQKHGFVAAGLIA